MLEIAVTRSFRLTRGEQQLAGLRARMGHLDDFARVGLEPVTLAMLRRHWETRGAAFGHPWRPLAPSTILQRARKGTLAKGPLRDTDTMFRAVFSPAARRITLTRAGVRLSLVPDDPKWIFHQLGTFRMPARQPIPQPLPRSYTDDVRDLVRDFLLTGRARGAAGRFIAFAGSTQ